MFILISKFVNGFIAVVMLISYKLYVIPNKINFRINLYISILYY